MDASKKIDNFLDSYPDWRSSRLKELRTLIKETAPELTEDFKWGVPVWTHDGLVCAISGFKNYVKINFFKGVYLPDPKSRFNSGLDSKEHRSINLAESDKLDKPALTDIIRAAAAYNK